MKMQHNAWSCGAYAVYNALRTLGARVSSGRVMKVARPTRDGMNERDVIRTIKGSGGCAEEFSSSIKSHAWYWLHGSLVRGYPVVLCVDNWGHWVSAIGVNGERIIIVDSDLAEGNVAMGTDSLSRRTLMRRWWYRDKQPNLYGISVSKGRGKE